MTLDRDFATRVNLPCRIHCGPKKSLHLAGTARRMDVRALTLSVAPGHPEWSPKPSEPVVLEISLPGGEAKVLHIRGRVWRVQGLENGSRQVEVHFRKAMFRDEKPQRGELARGQESGLVM